MSNNSNSSGVGSPAVGGYTLWLDAADPLNTGTQPSSNTNLTTWYDKSGANNHAQAAGYTDKNLTPNTVVPWVKTGFNGSYPYVNFNNFTQQGSNQWGQCFLGPLNITTNVITVFGVATSLDVLGSGTGLTEQPNGSGDLMSFGVLNERDYNNNSYFAIQGNSGTGYALNRNIGDSGGPLVAIDNNPPAYRTAYIWTYQFDGTTATASVQTGASTTQFNTSGSTGNFSIFNYGVGCSVAQDPFIGAGWGSYLYAQVAELLVYNSALSLSNRQLVEGYLAMKWGLLSRLSLDHPYRQLPTPTAPSLTSTSITSRGFTINWSNATAATSYRYSISPSVGSYRASPGGTSGSVVYRGLNALTSYTITVTAINSSGQAPSSLSVSTISRPPCFLEGTKILCFVDDKEVYLPIQTLQKGTLVKTRTSGYKAVTYLGYSKLNNEGLDSRGREQLYVCLLEQYPELTEPLYITGCHSILVDSLTEEQRKEIMKVYKRVFVTEGKYRLESYLDERASPWLAKGEFTVWHVSLENENDVCNYGIYANGLLVESICNRRIKSSNTLTLV